MSIASRIESIEQHLTDDYSVLTLAGADLTNVDKNILNLKPTWKERLLYFMNNGTQQVWNNWTKVNGTGETLTLNNTEEAPMSLVYKGNTLQNGTPTPDSPVPIQVVSGDNSIVVCGRNLAYTGWAEDFVARINITSRAEIVIYDNKNCLHYEMRAGYGDYENKYLFKINWKENTQYTFSLDIINPTRNFTNMAIVYTDSTTTNFGTDLVANTWTHKVVTSTENKTIDYVRVNYQDGWCYVDLDTFMVYEGPETLPYEAYKGASYPISLGDIELLKIGTYQDKIFKNTPNTTDYDSELEDNVWYLKKEIGKVLLDGSEAWYQAGTQLPNTFTAYTYSNDMIDTYVSTDLVFISDNFKGVPNSGNYTSNDSNIITQNSSNQFKIMILRIEKSLLSSVDTTGFKTWLSTHNTIAYYPLATPTYTLIEDSTLINQLESMKKSYENQTNISQTNNDLPFELDVSALSK